MTAQVLTGDKLTAPAFSGFRPYLLYKLRYLRPQIILNSIFAVLSYPAMGLFFMLASFCESEFERLRETVGTASRAYADMVRLRDTLSNLFMSSVVIGVCCLGGLVVMSFVLLQKGFRYLYSRTYVDMDYSLPINGTTRFFGDISACFAGSLLPHLISVITGIIFLRAGLSVYPDTAEYEATVNLLIQGAFTGMFCCFMFMGLSLLLMSAAGKGAEARLYPLVINAVIPLIHMMCIYIVVTGAYGVSVEGFDREFMSVSATSPLGLLITSIASLVSAAFNGKADTAALPLFKPEYAVPAWILAIAFLVGAYFLITRRRNERVGNAYVYGAMRLIIPGVVIFAITAPISMGIFSRMDPLIDGSLFYVGDRYYENYAPHPEGYVTALIIITFVAYVVMDLISNKSFRRFYMTVAKWAGTLGVCFGICLILHLADGFGAGNFVPAASDVSTATISIVTGGNDYYNETVYSEGEIEKITAIHREIPKRLNFSEYIRNNPNEKRCHAEIRYEMKDGTLVLRQYYIEYPRFEEYTERLISPQSYYETKFGGYFEKTRDVDIIKAAGGYDYDTLTFNTHFDNGGIAVSDLCEALRKDCEYVTKERYYSELLSGYSVYVELYLANSRDSSVSRYRALELSDWMTETAKLLMTNADAGSYGDIWQDTSMYIDAPATVLA